MTIGRLRARRFTISTRVQEMNTCTSCNFLQGLQAGSELCMTWRNAEALDASVQHHLRYKVANDGAVCCAIPANSMRKDD